MTSDILQFTGEETIGDILQKMPDARDILSGYGLSCVGCHVNVYETLEQGTLGHGFSREQFEDVLRDLNDMAREKQIPVEGVSSQEVFLTPVAAEKIRAFQKEDDKLGFGFKIEVLQNDGNMSYYLDFLEFPEKGDTIIESERVKLFLSPESVKALTGYRIDFGEENGEEGFKIEKV